MTPEEFRLLLDSRPLVADGGLATLLEARGHDIGGALWSARVLREHPDAVEGAHREFSMAGAEILISASYQVSRRGLVAAGGTEAEADSLLRRSIDLARAGADDRPVLIAASVGPWGATNHDGSEYRGGYDIAHDELVAFHRQRLEVLVSGEPDLLAIETIPDLREVEAIVEALSDHPDLAAWLSVTTLDGQATCAGQPLTDVAAAVVGAPSVVAVGVNCSAPHRVAAALSALGSVGDAALVAYPNAGQTWDAASETWSGPAVGQFDDELVSSWRDAGARIVGGCCGVGPEGVMALRRSLAGDWHSS